MAFDKWISDLHPELSMGEAAQIALKDRLGGVLHFLPLAAHLADEDVEYVHQLRVATRRAMAALDLFAESITDQQHKRMWEALREIRKSADQARDLDVYIERIESLDGRGAKEFTERLKRRRRRAQRPLLDVAIEHLAEQRLKRRSAKLLKRLNTTSAEALTPYGEWCREQLRQEWGTFSSCMPEADPTPEALHDFRIEVKHFRYAMELLAAGLGPLARDQVYPLVTQLQGELGALQDHAIAREKLAHWHRDSKEPKVRELLSRLMEQEQEELSSKTRKFRAHWQARGASELADAVEHLLADVPS